MTPRPTPLPDRRTVLAAAAAIPLAAAAGQPRAAVDRAALDRALTVATDIPGLNALIVSVDGAPVAERVVHGPPLDRPVNVKSVSKSVISALVGIAIDRGILRGVDQPVAEILPDAVPRDGDPRLLAITLGHLLSMRAGLERTSGANYGRWVASADWVRFALSRPFVDEPGGGMLYSTGNTHVLSAVLTRAARRDTLALAREWLGEPLDITVPPWPRDPQGIYFGGNDMLLSPRAMVRFGETYRNGGVRAGRQVVPRAWVEASWTERTRSVFTGDGYGYGWFATTMAGHPVRYAWGYGGQLIHVVPTLGLVVAMTSDTAPSPGRNRDVRRLHALVAEEIVPAVADDGRGGPPSRR